MNGASLSSRGEDAANAFKACLCPFARDSTGRGEGCGRAAGGGRNHTSLWAWVSIRQGRGRRRGGGEGHDPKPHYSFHFGINGATRDFCSGIILLYYLIGFYMTITIAVVVPILWRCFLIRIYDNLFAITCLFVLFSSSCSDKDKVILFGDEKAFLRAWPTIAFGHVGLCKQ